MEIYYFGYGSNMSASIMKEWCPHHKLLGKAKLEGWALSFTRHSKRWQAGVADIVLQDNGVVWGALYKLTNTDLDALDRKEGNGRHYQRIQVRVECEDKQYSAFTYHVIKKLSNNIPTSIAYRDTMLTGANELSLPQNYIDKIASLPVSPS